MTFTVVFDLGFLYQYKGKALLGLKGPLHPCKSFISDAKTNVAIWSGNVLTSVGTWNFQVAIRKFLVDTWNLKLLCIQSTKELKNGLSKEKNNFRSKFLSL